MPGKERVKPAATATRAAAPYAKAAAKDAAPAKKAAKKDNPLFTSRPKNFGIGRDVPYKRDLSRFMRWPSFVQRQRKKRVLERRLKVPPTLNQFRKALDRTTRNELLKLLKKYAPETRKERRERLKKQATAKAADPKKTVSTKKPLAVVSGIQEVTRAIERKRAKLVVIANNVDPIELVLWVPTLCRANKIPYAIVKDKARLGEVVNQSTATILAVTEVRAEDEGNLKNLIKSINARFLVRTDVIRRQYGGLQMSLRSRAFLRKKAARTTHVVAAVAGEDDE